MASYRVMGASASETPTLLWTNPSPTSNFASQTITNIDTSSYGAFIVKYRRSTSSNDTDEFYQNKTVLFGHYICISMEDTSTAIRNCSVQSNGIYFASTLNLSHGTDNSEIIPIEIYGLKKALL